MRSLLSIFLCLLTTSASAAPPAPYNVPKNLKGVIHAKKAKRLPREARARLQRDASVVVAGREKHFYALYDRNAYEKVPSFVSLDAVLHLFHLRFDRLLADTEAKRAQPALRRFAQRQTTLALKGLEPGNETGRWLATFHGVALRLLTKGDYSADAASQQAAAALYEDPRIAAEVRTMSEKIEAAKGRERSPLCPGGLDLSLFEPRGHYDWRLERYFRAMTWYGQCGFDLSEPDRLRQAVELLRLLDPDSRKSLAEVRAIMELAVGVPDDPGVEELEAKLPADLPPWPTPVPDPVLAEIAKAVARLPQPRIPANASPAEPRHRTFRLLGPAGVPDSVLFAKTAAWNQGRPLPSVLDLLAALGSADARALLAEEMARVPALATALKSPLSIDNRASLYGRWLRVLGTVAARPGAGHPSFELTDAWARHLTVAAAGSWAELRHDTLLYVKQPLVWAEGGHGAELPALEAAGYVEPRPEVYRALTALLDLLAESFPTKEEDSLVTRLRSLLLFLTDVAERELDGRPIPPAADARLKEIGVEMEELTRGHADELPPQALVADVYTFIEPNGATHVLHAGIGDVDELWVVVPRGKRLVLMRGGVFSYYELPTRGGERYSDRDWLERLRGAAAPARPEWARPVGIPERRRRGE